MKQSKSLCCVKARILNFTFDRFESRCYRVSAADHRIYERNILMWQPPAHRRALQLWVSEKWSCKLKVARVNIDGIMHRVWLIYNFSTMYPTIKCQLIYNCSTVYPTYKCQWIYNSSTMLPIHECQLAYNSSTMYSICVQTCEGSFTYLVWYVFNQGLYLTQIWDLVQQDMHAVRKENVFSAED